MSIRTTTMLAGLVLAVAALSPASALAKAGGADRPVKGTVSGTVSANVQAFAITGEGTGVAAHLGRFTSSLEGAIAITPEGTEGGGTQTIVAANGDQLTGTFTLSTPGLPSEAHTTMLVTTLTGGTGRFSDAHGILRSVLEVSPMSFDGLTLVNGVEGTVRGRISY
jgi:hypothetical protein